MADTRQGTYARAIVGAPPPRRVGLLTPSSTFIPGQLPMAPARPLAGGPNYDHLRRSTGGSNAEGYTPGRGLSVGEIMSQREGRSNAYYTATGQPVARGTVLNAQGWNTSGVGPGTRGYTGSWRPGGYNGGAGTGRPTGQQGFGGLNDFYQQQQGMNSWDRLQGQQSMDQQDAMGSEMAQRSRIAMQNGDYDTAAQFAQALSDRQAQRMAAQGFSQPGEAMDPLDPWAGRTSYGDPGAFSGPSLPQGPMSSWDEAAMRNAPTSSLADIDPNSEYAQAMLDQAALNGRVPIERYGTGSSVQGQNIGPFGTNATFTNAQGSAGPGGTRTSYGGTQSSGDFFQGAADRQGVKNNFRSPQMGYGGIPDLSTSMADYARRMKSTNDLLKK